jgi:hypothetical protein
MRISLDVRSYKENTGGEGRKQTNMVFRPQLDIGLRHHPFLSIPWSRPPVPYPIEHGFRP